MHTWFNELLCHGGIICPITFWDVGLIDFSLLRGEVICRPLPQNCGSRLNSSYMTKTILRTSQFEIPLLLRIVQFWIVQKTNERKNSLVKAEGAILRHQEAGFSALFFWGVRFAVFRVFCNGDILL